MAEIIWTIPALNDLETILEYIALDDPLAANRFAKRVFEETDRLKLFPLSGSVPKELHGTKYRKLVVSPIVIYHRKEKKQVYIVHVSRGEVKFRLGDILGSDKL